MEINAIQKEENVIWEGVQEWEGRKKLKNGRYQCQQKIDARTELQYSRIPLLTRHQITRHTILSSTQSNNQPPHRSHTLNPLRHN